jgi:signal peptidase I
MTGRLLPLLVVTAVLSAGGAAAGLLRRRLMVVAVDGPSMRPTYQDGDRLLVLRTRPGAVRRGQVVIFAPPRSGAMRNRPIGGRIWLVKRVAAAPGDPVPPGLAPALTGLAGTPVPPGCLVVLGDNPTRSHDSRQDGFLESRRVGGRVLRCLGAG